MTPPTPSNLQPNNLIFTPQQHSQQCISSAITGGADRLVALIEEENANIEARNREQLDNLQKSFDQYRQEASNAQQKLNDRIHVLEAELAAKGEEGDAERITWSQAAATLDPDAIHVVQELVRLVKAGESWASQQRKEGLTFAQDQLPKEFIPTLAQYLISSKQKMQIIKGKQRHAEKERDSLKEKLVMLSQKLQRSNDDNVAASDSAQAIFPAQMKHKDSLQAEYMPHTGVDEVNAKHQLH